MSYRKHRVALPGLLAIAVALGAMAFAASAQAVTPSFTINGKIALHASVTGMLQEGPGYFLVPKSNLEIQCKEFEVKQGLILTGSDADVTLLYKECKTFSISPKLEELPCHVSDVTGGKPELLHVALSALLLPIEFADGSFGALAEKIVSTINFLKETGCTLPLKNELKGEICFSVESKTNNTTKPIIKSDQKTQEECPQRNVLEGAAGGTVKDKLLFGVNEAFADAKATLQLTGEHAGLTLGVSLL